MWAIGFAVYMGLLIVGFLFMLGAAKLNERSERATRKNLPNRGVGYRRHPDYTVP